MGDPTKFRYLWEYYSFHVVLACLLLSELFIFLYTMQRGPRAQTAKGDHGTKWLLPDLLQNKIRVEEKALEAQFGKEYADYKRSTYRLFPYIF